MGEPARGAATAVLEGKIKSMKFVVSISRDEDGVFIAQCPALPGCVSQGNTEAEAELNIADAIRECLLA